MAKRQKNAKKKGSENQQLLFLSLNLYASFYPKFYFLETTLKNRLFTLIKQKFGENWFQAQLNSPADNSIFTVEAETILRRKPKGFILKDKGLLVESGLGMWIELFNRDSYKLLKGVPILIFPKLPPQIKRKDLYQKLTRVKDLRNQLAHYRIPALTESTQLDAILKVNDDLVELLVWLDIPTEQINTKDSKRSLAAVKKMLG